MSLGICIIVGKLGVSELKATSCFNRLLHVPSWLQTPDVLLESWNHWDVGCFT